jgi:ankyrin repeat protein
VSELFAAVAAGDQDAVVDLLDRRPELAGERDAEGLSLVLHALFSGQGDLVEPILDANPPLDVFDAAAVGRTRGLEELLDAEPELVQATRPDGSTPLHLAARFDRADAVEVLLERGADRGARDGEGRTPADVAGDEARDLLAGGG